MTMLRDPKKAQKHPRDTQPRFMPRVGDRSGLGGGLSSPPWMGLSVAAIGRSRSYDLA